MIHPRRSNRFIVPAALMTNTTNPAFVNPWKLVEQVLNEMHTGGEANTTSDPQHPSFSPAVDVFDRGNSYQVLVNLPGVKSEDVSLQLEGRSLKLQANAKSTPGDGTETTAATSKQLLSERPNGQWNRTITLPHRVDAEAITAKLEDGVLSITITKAAEVQSKQISIS
jgi:HSP20 family protein